MIDTYISIQTGRHIDAIIGKFEDPVSIPTDRLLKQVQIDT